MNGMWKLFGCVTCFTCLVANVLAEGASANRNVYVEAYSGLQLKELPCHKGMPNRICDLRMYEIMVEAFIDADEHANHDAGYGTSHHRGDIKGVISALDYIESLGINAIWITPVFESKGDFTALNATGYFATNMFDVDPKFGTKEQLKEFVDAAHSRGIYVFFDGVFGRSEKNTKPSPEGRVPSGKNPAVFPDDLDYFKEVAAYWIKELKIDGWRMDQGYLVPIDIWREIKKEIVQVSKTVTYKNRNGKNVNPLGYMVGEFWESPAEIRDHAYGTKENPVFNSTFAFPLRSKVVNVFAANMNGTHSVPADSLFEQIKGIYETYPDHAMPNLMLENHDMPRLGDLLQRSGLADIDDDEYWARLKNIFSYQAAVGGPITLYYGQEIGDQVVGFDERVLQPECVKEGVCEDHASRNSGRVEGLPSVVNGEPTVLSDREKDMKDYVSTLLNLRKNYTALSAGKVTHVYSDKAVYIDRKDALDNSILYLTNVGKNQVNVLLNKKLFNCEGLNDLLGKKRIDSSGKYFQVTLDPHASKFYEIIESECLSL